MGKRKPIRVFLDWGHRNADWLKQLPQAKQDLAASEQAVKELREERLVIRAKRRSK